MHDPRVDHMQSLKRIIRYIQGTLNHGIHICVYSISSLISYIDVDLGVALIHDILRLAIALGDNLIPWSFKRQPTLS